MIRANIATEIARLLGVKNRRKIWYNILKQKARTEEGVWATNIAENP